MRKLTLLEMRRQLTEQRDFKLEPTLLQSLCIDLAKKYAPDLSNVCQGDTNPCIDMIYSPKFHCELQEKIERAWAYSKASCASRVCSSTNIIVAARASWYPVDTYNTDTITNW